MNSSRRILIVSLALLVALAAGCGGGDDDGPTTPPPPSIGIDDAVEGYWDANEGVATQLLALADIVDQIEAGLTGDKAASDAEITALVDRYVAGCDAAAARFDELIALEDAIQPHGSAGKGMFTDTVKGVVKGIYNTGKKAVVSSGQMLRTGWRVLSGSHSLREALSATDSGIPIVSDFAQRLQQHNAARDARILEAIENGNDQMGYVPLDQLPGADAAEKANAYRNLPDDHPLKKQIRGDVHLWDDGEKAETVRTLKKSAQDGLKTYAGATSGSDALGEIGEQLLSPDQDPADQGTIQPSIQDADSEQGVAETKTMIINKRDQPEDQPRIVMLQGVDADFEAEVPAGHYDVVVIAEDYIRSAEVDVELAAGVITDFLLEMYRYAENSIIIESMGHSPVPGAVGAPVRCDAVVVSTLGNSLSFEWSATGGGVTAESASGADYAFTPLEEGEYTVTVTVTDEATGFSRSQSLGVHVAPVNVQVTSVEIAAEQIDDGEWNPGEQVDLLLTIGNTGDEAVTGTLALEGLGGAVVVSGAASVAVDPGGNQDLTATVRLPVDWSQPAATVRSALTTGDVVIEQDIVLDVAFYVEIDPIASPVDARVLTITGLVANPSLQTARLAIGGDIDQVFDLNLSNGRFAQQVAVEASSSEVSHEVLLVADSGSWHEEDTTTFTSEVPPAGFRVTLSWNTNDTDVDLWVTDPSGETCKWNHPSTASGLALDFDDTDGYGPENITAGEPPAGAYLVQVHYYSDHDGDVAIPSSCSVVIRLNEGTEDEVVHNYYGTLGDTGDMWTVTTITLGESGLVQLADADAISRIDPSLRTRK
jgi:uncharacterized protein YfaP (DUF2135 family)